MEGGGAERVASRLCNAWVGEGHEVLLMPTYSGRGGCAYPLDSRVHLEFLADYVGTMRKTPLSSLKRLLALRKVIRDYSPDVIVSFLTHVNVVAIVAALGLGVSVVVSERIYPPLLPLPLFWRATRWLMYPQASCVVMQTQLGLKWIESHCAGINARVIPNPIGRTLPKNGLVIETNKWVEADRRVLLAVGRLNVQKGFDLLLEAFFSISKKFPNWDLVILGEGAERQALEAQREALGLGRRVYMPGRAGNVGEWYECADLYVMTSRYEGFPNTLLEAMAHGLPVVSVDCDTGPRDLISDEVNGLLVPLEQGVGGLSKALQRLMSDDALLKQMGQEAIKVRDIYSMEKIGTAWAEVLKLNA